MPHPRQPFLVASFVLLGLTIAAGAGDSGQSDFRPGQVKAHPRNELAYVWIPPGSFSMGCVPDDGDCDVIEEPRHRVTITKGFWMGRTEVTVRAYKRFARKTKRKMPPEPRVTAFNSLSLGAKSIADRFESGPGKKEDRPIVNVTWEEAQAFCSHSGGRLPTEAEWEYAARGGKDGLVYPWGDTLTHEYANYGGAAGSDQWRYSAPVASFPATGFGLHDVIGNVWEWCADWVDGNYYVKSPEIDPTGPAKGEERVARGGSWGFGPRYLRLSARVMAKPDSRGDNIGFRCVQEALR